MYGDTPPPPPPYAMLNAPGPQYYQTNHPNRKKSVDYTAYCCRCFCCFCFLFFFLVVLQFFSVVVLYFKYDPKVPSYHVENIDVKSLDLKPDSTLTTNINLTIRAENPNQRMEFIYGSESNITVEYYDVRICEGKLPAFRQGHENITILASDLTGVSTLGPGLHQNFTENQKNHTIPLNVKMEVPVRVVVDDTTLREFRVSVNCSMVVDGLTPGNSSHILSRETVFAVEV